MTNSKERDALYAQQGACNPIALAGVLAKYATEMYREGNDMTAVRSDPALRLLTHQLAHLMGVFDLDRSLGEYDRVTRECQAKIDANSTS